MIFIWLYGYLYPIQVAPECVGRNSRAKDLGGGRFDKKRIATWDVTGGCLV